MRHNKSGRKFGRTWEHRKALFRNMAKSLLTYGRIKTTETKAKELRKVADKLVTLALRNDIHARRQAFKVLGDHSLVNKLFDEVGPRFAGASGGYTRVVKMGLPRRGDSAPMAFIEFTRQPGEEAPQPKPKKTAAETPTPEAAPAQAAPEAEAAQDTEAPEPQAGELASDEAEAQSAAAPEAQADSAAEPATEASTEDSEAAETSAADEETGQKTTAPEDSDSASETPAYDSAKKE